MSALFALLGVVAGTMPVRVVADPGTSDWPMWGGTADRNQVSNMKNVPSEWDVKTKKNIKWVADLGSQSYGNQSSPREWCLWNQRAAARPEAGRRPRRAHGVP